MLHGGAACVDVNSGTMPGRALLLVLHDGSECTV